MANTDKIWLGWTPRESGSEGFRCVNGDSGKAQGKYQFDYRYALVPFMQFCIDKNSERYSGFNTFIKLGAKNSKLISNNELATLWTDYCDKYPEEFESLQDAYAYKEYYLPIKSQLKKLYEINLDDHHPAVKGSAFSMSIRSGSTSGAKKFSKCKNDTDDETILRSSYAMYNNDDSKRWTEAKQLGDALKALKEDIYTEISEDGSVIVKESTTTTNVEKTSDVLYRVGTGWKNGKCVGQIGAFKDKDNAIESANSASSENSNTTYYVFDEDGNTIYQASIVDTVTSTTLYRVGTGWKNGKCVGQIGAFKNLDNAKAATNGSRNIFKKTYYVFDEDGNIVYTVEYTNPKDNYYRVGTGWKNGKCVNQEGAFSIATNAIELAESLTKSKNKQYYVFDPTGSIIYTGKN